MFEKKVWTNEEKAQARKIRDNIQVYICANIVPEMRNGEVIRVAEGDDVERINLIIKRKRTPVVMVQFPFSDPCLISEIDSDETIELMRMWQVLKMRLQTTITNRKTELENLAIFEV